MTEAEELKEEAAGQRSSAVVTAGLGILFALIVGKFIFAHTDTHSGPTFGSLGWWMLALVGLAAVFVSFELTLQRLVRANYYSRQANAKELS